MQSPSNHANPLEDMSLVHANNYAPPSINENQTKKRTFDHMNSSSHEIKNAIIPTQ